MATTFEIFLATEDKSYALSIAQQAWTLLDTLEDKLSRFRPHSAHFNPEYAGAR